MTPREPIRVVFMASMPFVWQSVASVYRACAKDARFACTVFVQPGDFLGPGRLGDHITPYLAAQRIPFVTGGIDELRALRPDVIFVPTPFENQRPPEFGTVALAAIARLAYVPYGLEIGGGWQEQQFAQPLHDLAWRVFARSERHRALLARYGRRDAANVAVTGHPKLDGYFDGAWKGPGSGGTRRGEPKVVLWNPHFQAMPDNSGWSTFVAYHEAIPELFAERFTDLVLVYRPHKYLLAWAVTQGVFAQADYEQWLDWLRGMPNVVLDSDPHYYPLFKRSDAMISDTSSFLFEYLPTGKPVCYLDNPAGPGLNEEGTLVDRYYRAADVDGVAAFLEQVRSGHDPMREQRVAAIDEYLYRVDGGAGARIRDHIHAAIVAEETQAA